MDGAIDVWDLTRGDQVARMVHPGNLVRVAFSPDGSAVATADDKGAVRLWSPGGELKAALREPAYGPQQLIFSEDGRYLAVAARTPGLFVLDLHGQLAATHLLSSRDADLMAFGSRYLAASDRGKQLLRIWETAGARELPGVKADGLDGLALDFTGTFLATREQDGRGHGLLRVRALPDLRALGFTLQMDSSSTFGLGPQGKYLAVEVVEPGANRYAPNRYVDVWDIAAARRVTRVPHEGGELQRIVYRPDGGALFTVAEGGEVRAWALPAGKLTARLSHEEDVSAIRFSADGKVLATVSEGRVYAWNASTGELLSQLAEAGYVRDARFSPDGRYLLTGSADGTAAVWRWRTEDLRDEACKRLSHNLTPSEWQRYLGDRPYRNTCPNLPAGEQR
jgi:WD40 repeat protein